MTPDTDSTDSETTCSLCNGEGTYPKLDTETNTFELVTCPVCDGDGTMKEVSP